MEKRNQILSATDEEKEQEEEEEEIRHAITVDLLSSFSIGKYVSISGITLPNILTVC